MLRLPFPAALLPGIAMSQPEFSLTQKLDEIHRLLEKFDLENTVLERQNSDNPLIMTVTRRAHNYELLRHLKPLHAADIAHIIETLKPDERMQIWRALPNRQRGDVLLELSSPVLTAIINETSRKELLAALAQLDVDDLNYLSDSLNSDILEAAAANFDRDNRQLIIDTANFSEDQVGHWMSIDVPTVYEHNTLARVRDELQRIGQLPSSTDKLIVINVRGSFCGVLPLEDILLGASEARVGDIMKTRAVTFRPTDNFAEVARAFERYDLISAPVLNERGKAIGRLTFDTVMDYLREEAEADTLNMAGVIQAEDVYASVWSRARNRWLWLTINMVTAFAVSRIIGLFESSISQIAALASLMPIVASMAGNTGNQTTALVIRNLATRRLDAGAVGSLLRGEVSVALLNGSVWGVLVGLFTLVFYHNLALAAVVAVAMMLSIVLAALLGVGTPYLLERSGRDPAMGSSVILTGLTDAMGFSIFLLLATIVLL